MYRETGLVAIVAVCGVLAAYAAVGERDESAAVMNLHGITSMTTNGPLLVRLSSESVPRIDIADASSQVEIHREGQRLIVSNNAALLQEPVVVTLVLPELQRIRMTESGSGGGLHIRLGGQDLLRLEHIEADQVCVQVEGHGRFEAGTLEAGDLRLVMSEYARLRTPGVQSARLRLLQHDHSDVKLAGRVGEQQIKLAQYSRFEADRLRSRTVRADLQGYSTSHVWATEVVELRADPKSGFRYAGTPIISYVRSASLDGSPDMTRQHLAAGRFFPGEAAGLLLRLL